MKIEPQDPSVLIISSSQDLIDLSTERLSNTYTVETAGGTEALDHLDKTVDILLFDRRMPDISIEDMHTTVQKRNPDCGSVLLTSRKPNFDILERGFDACLEKPVAEDELHETVNGLWSRMQYNEYLQEYLSLLSKQAATEAHKNTAESQTDPEFLELEERLSECEDELQELLSQFTDADYRALFHAFSDEAGDLNPQGQVDGYRTGI
ncbi:HalX domain-containing protein [Natronococcus wangiae]|uniref:HalX domain-containing protein n=1 Tax=Natronococcus wangiae TaxID=3068275 RepID=UPI00273F7F6B|nr:HalX domain-containing protein [Natronococcus sp. AD5]